MYQDEVMVRKQVQISGKDLKDATMEIQMMKADLVTELELLITIYVVMALQQVSHIVNCVSMAIIQIKIKKAEQYMNEVMGLESLKNDVMMGILLMEMGVMKIER